MIEQKELKVKVEATDAAVTAFAGASALVQVAYQMGLLCDLDRLPGMKKRRRGFSPGASVLDLMLLSCLGGECIDDLAVLRADRSSINISRSIPQDFSHLDEFSASATPPMLKFVIQVSRLWFPVVMILLRRSSDLRSSAHH